MEADIPTKEEYVKNLNDLYIKIEEWLKDSSIISFRKDIFLPEDSLGEYTAPALTLSDKKTNKIIAEIRPAGQIIGARGRVDIIGSIDKQFLVYLTEVPKGKLRITLVKNPLITSGDMQPGWYWIDSMPLRQPHCISQDLFLDLITSVSDYDARQHA